MTVINYKKKYHGFSPCNFKYNFKMAYCITVEIFLEN